ncbi:MAG TPA: heavy metal translocating P-type ATPase [Thermoplasmata archaeon]|nr:heavy metal translocating P-type ATPase [Thermoplasmata archaeon]
MATDPICGMAVDEATAELKLQRENRTYYFCSEHCLREFADPRAELARLRRLLTVAWPLAVVVLVLTYTRPFVDWDVAALGLAAVVQFYPGSQFYRSTWDALGNRSWNMDVLIAVGTTVAFGYSAVSVAFPAHLVGAYYLDASSLIIALILTGNYLEHLTRDRARGTIGRLRELLPQRARVVRGDRELELPADQVVPGDLVQVRPGGRLPADGIVVSGRSQADESILTGESLPVPKGPGDRVLAGAVNGEGELTVRADRVGEDLFLAEIGRLVAEAETSRVPLQQLADRIASRFVPFVLLVGLALGGLWAIVGQGPTIGLLVFVSVVITACPCAFGIATPAAVVVGTGRAAEEGVLFRGRDSLERASEVDLVVTDKTGTLTQGRPTLVGVVPRQGVDATELLRLAAAVESGSEHPLAGAVRRAASERGLPMSRATDVRAEPGRGVSGRFEGREVSVRAGAETIGGPADLGPLAVAAATSEREGRTYSVVLADGAILGLLEFDDPIAAGAADGVRALREDGIEVVMATGDHEATARRVAAAAGISQVHASLDPAGKLSLLQRYREQGRRVAFVGDGINDAPALAAADLGIAIGAGTDVAREAGGVILVRSDFRSVATALRLGRRTVRKVRGNLTWALGYNGVLLPIAGGALVPIFGLGVYAVLPVTGALAMGFSSTLVVLNSLSLRWVRLG